MRLKRTLVICVIVLVALGGVAYIAFQAWLQVLGIDEEPTDDGDLRVEPQPIPAEDNAYTHFVRASGILMHLLTDVRNEDAADPPTPDSEEGLEPHDRAQVLCEILEARRFDTAAAENVLSRSSEVFAAFRQGMAARHCQAPEVSLANTDELRIGGLIELGRLLQVRARYLSETGRSADALAQSLEIARFGQQLERAGGPLILCLTGMSLKSIGAHEASRALADGAPTSKELKAGASALSSLADCTEGLRQAMKVEYSCLGDTIEGLCSGELDPDTLQPCSDGQIPPEWQFRRNETRRLLAERIRIMMANAGRPMAAMAEVPPVILKDEWKYHTLLRGNALGRILLTLAVPPLKVGGWIKCRHTTRIRIVAAALAVQAFVEENQRLPWQLGELVPDYLGAVPLDDFDGKPIRYSREKRIVYCVGEDLKDDGGFTEEEGKAWAKEHLYLDEGKEPDPWQLPDPSWPIEFKDEAM